MRTMSQLLCKTGLATALLAAACSQPGLAQVAPSAILQIDVESTVRYDEDISDASKFATVLPGPRGISMPHPGSHDATWAAQIPKRPKSLPCSDSLRAPA